VTSRLCIVACMRLTGDRQDAAAASNIVGDIKQACRRQHAARGSTSCCTGRENEKLAAFKAFWSSDHPLIGEPCARGWAHTVASAGVQCFHI